MDRMEFGNLVSRAIRGEVTDMISVQKGAEATRKQFKKMLDDKKKFKIYLSEESDLQATELIVIAPDHHGLFSLISGLVAASGYDIVSAKIITRSDGYALDTFFIQQV